MRRRFVIGIALLALALGAVAWLGLPRSHAASVAAAVERAQALDNSGAFAAAEAAADQALLLIENGGAADARQQVAALLALGEAQQGEGRGGEAEAVYRRALAAAESGFGDDDETVADVLNFLAVRALARGAVEEARDFGGRAYHIEQGVAHARHPDAATDQDAEVDLGLDGDAIYDTSILVAGRILEAEGDVEGAIRAYRAVIASLENKKGRERLLGEAFERLARALMQTQEFRDAQGDVRREAVDLAHRAHDTLEGVLGPDHPLVLATDSLIADTEFYFSDAALAEGWMSDAVDRLARQIDAIGRAGRAEQRAARALFLADVRLLVGLKSQAQFIGVARDFLEGPYRPPNPEMALGASPTLGLSNADVGSFDWDKPYAAMQWAKSSDTAAAVAHMAARFATGNDDPGLAKLVRERAAARERLDEIDGGLLTDADKAASDRDLAAERDRRAEADKLANELAADDAELARRFPRYAELVKPQPIGIAETQKLLAPDEAMLVFAVGDDDAYVAVVGARSFGLYPLAANDAGSFALNEPTLEDWVAKVRPRYDEKKSQLAPFDAATAFALYHALFGPAEKQLQGIRQLYIVGEGPLDSLPWDALLTAKPAAATLATPTQLRAAPWLAKRYAVTVLPSASSLRMLREFAQGSPAPLPFLGIGDPLLKDHPPAAGEARGIDIDAAFRGGAVDVAALRDLPSLPETAHELEVEAQLFNAGTDSLMLRQSATVTAVKHADLADRRIVSFATHGLVAGDVGVAEPGLVLTPPPQPTPEDDGLLKASEIAQLKLNADMVILSACDTAATDGKPDAEGFSGLAKAFFYAGARSLLVSNWDVVSTSTVELMTRVAAHLDERGIGRAEALRRAALDVMNDRAHPEFAHPLFWAPFVVVGEGGAE